MNPELILRGVVVLILASSAGVWGIVSGTASVDGSRRLCRLSFWAAVAFAYAAGIVAVWP